MVKYLIVAYAAIVFCIAVYQCWNDGWQEHKEAERRRRERRMRHFIKVGRDLGNALTMPILAVGAAAVKATLDFEEASKRIATALNLSGSDIEDLRRGIEDLGRRYPR